MKSSKKHWKKKLTDKCKCGGKMYCFSGNWICEKDNRFKKLREL